MKKIQWFIWKIKTIFYILFTNQVPTEWVSRKLLERAEKEDMKNYSKTAIEIQKEKRKELRFKIHTIIADKFYLVSENVITPDYCEKVVNKIMKTL